MVAHEKPLYENVERDYVVNEEGVVHESELCEIVGMDCVLTAVYVAHEKELCENVMGSDDGVKESVRNAFEEMGCENMETESGGAVMESVYSAGNNGENVNAMTDGERGKAVNDVWMRGAGLARKYLPFGYGQLMQRQVHE